MASKADLWRHLDPLRYLTPLACVASGQSGK
jgi:hypothetical protein